MGYPPVIFCVEPLILMWDIASPGTARGEADANARQVDLLLGNDHEPLFR